MIFQRAQCLRDAGSTDAGLKQDYGTIADRALETVGGDRLQAQTPDERRGLPARGGHNQDGVCPDRDAGGFFRNESFPLYGVEHLPILPERRVVLWV